jgi:predicted N-acyltransferase
MASISHSEWDLCAGTVDPFLSYAFLSTLEESGSVGPQTGWNPSHFIIRDQSAKIQAVIPHYTKLHSYGEYVFDQVWAQAFHRLGKNYYPKSQICIPMSPVTGTRFLRHPQHAISISEIGSLLSSYLTEQELSSLHITFCSSEEWSHLGQEGWLQRLGIQFHWNNAGYKNFDEFLSQLSSSHRKSIKRERRLAQSSGLTFLTVQGDDIKEHHWEAFYHFYINTIDKKWGNAYLTKSFFNLLSQNLGDKVILMMAYHNNQPVAGALHLQGEQTLYGRLWGCHGDWPFLHFELCYYRALDYAIEQSLKTVEAGAQGEHKLQRGYLPQKTYSCHLINHEPMNKAIKHYLLEETKMIEQQIHHYETLSPFKQS